MVGLASKLDYWWQKHFRIPFLGVRRKGRKFRPLKIDGHYFQKI